MKYSMSLFLCKYLIDTLCTKCRHSVDTPIAYSVHTVLIPFEVASGSASEVEYYLGLCAVGKFWTHPRCAEIAC